MIKFREILPLYAVIFLGFVGYALTITLFIPMLMNTTFPLVPANTSVAARASLSGFLLAMYPLGQFFGSPVIGTLSDHFGRKKVLLLSLVACLFGFIGMGLSIHFHQLLLLFISSFITGLFESNMAISQSVIADRVDDTFQKTRLIGYAYSSCSLGWVVGASLGGIGGTALGYSAPFWITAVGVLCLMSWVSYSFKEHA
ncbi:MAG: MFS transporter, partial [Gammaproteobacteria bacterium]|nr:MFS transporter [Gammaproteobacteria bacterium]